MWQAITQGVQQGYLGQAHRVATLRMQQVPGVNLCKGINTVVC